MSELHVSSNETIADEEEKISLDDDQVSLSSPQDRNYETISLTNVSVQESSTKSVSNHESEEILVAVVNEAQLMKKFETLTHELKRETERKVALNNLLFEYLNDKGISCQQGMNEDAKSVDDYNQALERLFNLTQRKKLIDEAQNLRSLEAKAELQQRTEELNRLKSEFNETLTTTLTNPLPSTEKQVTRLTKRFNKVYDSMSVVRLEFIERQNSLVEQAEIIKNLGEVGDGLKTLDYENMTTEVQTIMSSIDLKQEQMDKLSGRFRKDSKALISSKSVMDENLKVIEKKTLHLESLREQQVSLIISIKNLGIQKKKLKDKLNDLNDKAGLLSHPLLMKHYDKVVKEIEDLTEEISKVEAFNKKLSSEAQMNQSQLDVNENPQSSKPKPFGAVRDSVWSRKTKVFLKKS